MCKFVLFFAPLCTNSKLPSLEFGAVFSYLFSCTITYDAFSLVGLLPDAQLPNSETKERQWRRPENNNLKSARLGGSPLPLNADGSAQRQDLDFGSAEEVQKSSRIRSLARKKTPAYLQDNGNTGTELDAKTAARVSLWIVFWRRYCFTWCSDVVFHEKLHDSSIDVNPMGFGVRFLLIVSLCVALGGPGAQAKCACT